MKTDDTKQMIQHTFFLLAKNSSVPKITVSSLCQACSISRSTFYLHYDGVDDLTDSLERELLFSVEKIFKLELQIPLQNVENQTFFRLLTHVQAHLAEFQFFKNDTNFSHNLLQIVQKSLRNRLKYLGYPTEQHQAEILFCAGGVLQLLLAQMHLFQPERKQNLCSAYNHLLLSVFVQKL